MGPELFGYETFPHTSLIHVLICPHLSRGRRRDPPRIVLCLPVSRLGEEVVLLDNLEVWNSVRCQHSSTPLLYMQWEHSREA